LTKKEHYRIVIIISADGEWKAIQKIFTKKEFNNSIYGQWFVHEIIGIKAVFFHGGWGKISAAASTQYAIDTWKPELIINLGTCGGFKGHVKKNTIILVNKATVYDIYEQMTDNQTAIKNYSTNIDLKWLSGDLPLKVLKAPIVSGDRDLAPEEIPILHEKYDAIVGDWESGSISWVCQKNNVKLLILRGVSDLVGPSGGEAYEGRKNLWYKAAEQILKQLLETLPDWIKNLDNKNS
jgi:adenosylhomocysteine nucleosidase